jgi:ParB-like chromosome segregation protein Spo0J
MDIQQIAVSEIHAAQYNPRKELRESDAAYQRLLKGLDTFGLVEPLVFNRRSGNLVSGHQRFKILLARGDATVPCSVVDLDDKAEKALNLAMNTHAGEWDFASLSDLIAELSQTSLDLDLVGFNPQELDKLQAWPQPLLNDSMPLPERKYLRVETVELAKLKPHPRNFLKHPADQLEHLIQSIKEHGYYRNIVCARDNTVLAGHGVVEAVRKLGWLTVPVIRLDLDPLEPRALKVLTGDNTTRNLAIVDDRALTNLLREVKDVALEGLLGTGFDEMMLANLTFATRTRDEIHGRDDAKEWVGMPSYEQQELRVITLHFRNREDRERCGKLLGLPLGETDETVKNRFWWPSGEKRDIRAVRFEDQAVKRDQALADAQKACSHATFTANAAGGVTCNQCGLFMFREPGQEG